MKLDESPGAGKLTLASSKGVITIVQRQTTSSEESRTGHKNLMEEFENATGFWMAWTGGTGTPKPPGEGWDPEVETPGDPNASNAEANKTHPSPIRTIRFNHGLASLTQSSTEHSDDMQVNVGHAAYKMEARHNNPSRAAAALGGGPAGHPNPTVIDTSDDFWSARVERDVHFTIDSKWKAPVNAANNWSIQLDRSGARADNFRWGEKVSKEKKLDGGRLLTIDIYSDIDDREVDAKAAGYDLQGYIDDSSSKGRDGKMHPDWNGGLTVIRFDEGHNVVSPAELQAGELQDFAEGDSVPGKYRGIHGKYECTNGGDSGRCHIRRQSKEGVTVKGNFKFIPKTLEKVVSVDLDWLLVGVWQVEPDRADGDFEVGAFADGNDPFDKEESLAGLTGRAVYQGKAFGRYAEKTNKLSAIMVDTFEANAKLAASFDDGTELGTIQGELSDFQAVGTDATKWSLNLQKTAIGSTNDFRDDTSGYANGHAIEGRWGGRFYGNDHDSKKPGSVAGTFGAAMREVADANEQSGYMPNKAGYDLNLIGAFGAHCQNVKCN